MLKWPLAGPQLSAGFDRSIKRGTGEFLKEDELLEALEVRMPLLIPALLPVRWL